MKLYTKTNFLKAIYHLKFKKWLYFKYIVSRFKIQVVGDLLNKEKQGLSYPIPYTFNLLQDQNDLSVHT